MQDAGYKTTLIENFENVVDNLLEIDANLILLDINLPYMDGYDICKKIKKNQTYQLSLLQVVIQQKMKLKVLG